MSIINNILLPLIVPPKNKHRRSPLLDLRWPIITNHLLPGRVRFSIPLLVGQKKRISDLSKEMKKINGLEKFQGNETTGSILILFEESKIQAELLFSVMIRLLGLEKELERTPKPGIENGITTLNQGLNQAIYAKSKGFLDLKTGLPVILGIIGVYRLIAVRPISLPSSITLLWWAYNSLTHTKKGD